MPRRSSHASNGASAPPNDSIRFHALSIHVLLEQIAPAVRSLCPPRYLVALCTIMSIPKSPGRWLMGDAKVLSHIVVMPLLRAHLPTNARSVRARLGFDGVSR